jgi:hypothetical protein
MAGDHASMAAPILRPFDLYAVTLLPCHRVVRPISTLTAGVIEKPNETIAHVHFLKRGLASVVGTTAQHQRIEVGMVGYEGMTGLAVVLGHDRSTNETIIQASARGHGSTAVGTWFRARGSNFLLRGLSLGSRSSGRSI